MNFELNRMNPARTESGFELDFFSFFFLLTELQLSVNAILAAPASVTPYRSGLMNVHERERMTNRCTRDVFLRSAG